MRQNQQWEDMDDRNIQILSGKVLQRMTMGRGDIRTSTCGTEKYILWGKQGPTQPVKRKYQALGHVETNAAQGRAHNTRYGFPFQRRNPQFYSFTMTKAPKSRFYRLNQKRVPGIDRLLHSMPWEGHRRCHPHILWSNSRTRTTEALGRRSLMIWRVYNNSSFPVKQIVASVVCEPDGLRRGARVSWATADR